MKRVTITIYVHEQADTQSVEASIAGLDPRAALTVIEAAEAEAYRLLETRARLRHFRRPVTVRVFGSTGNLITKRDASGWTWGEDNPERGEPNAIVFEDARGRRAAVQVEIAR